MNLKLFLSQFYLPVWLKKKYMARLFDISEEAFEAGGRHFPQNASMNGVLREFAVFTKARAEQIINDKERSAETEAILFYSARSLGRQLRTELAVRNQRDVRIAAKSIYRALKIDFTCDGAGNVIIRKCFFSDFYSADVCLLISALDRGLIAGLTDGMRMIFSERITQNLPCCKARISR